MPIKLTKDEFILRAKKINGDKYDYSKVEYINNRIKVVIVCPIHGEFKQTPSGHLEGKQCNLCRIDSLKSLVCGEGINDLNTGISVYDKTADKSYIIWVSMLRRCYSTKSLKDNPTYIGCSVCKEWKLYSKFKIWCDKHYIEGYALDKDIIKKGNKIYSAEYCEFVPIEINSLILKSDNKRGNFPIGVYKNRKKFISGIRMNGKNRYIGSFNTPKDAFQSYKKVKEGYIKQVATEYYANGKINEKVYQALMKYEVKITD